MAQEPAPAGEKRTENGAGAAKAGLEVKSTEKDHKPSAATDAFAEPPSPARVPPPPPPKDDTSPGGAGSLRLNHRLSKSSHFSAFSAFSSEGLPRPVPARPPRPANEFDVQIAEALSPAGTVRSSVSFAAAASMASTTAGSTPPSARASWKLNLINKKPIKYGPGNIELSPQPSDDPEDPLNWPRWKKEVNFLSLLFVLMLNGAMKTALVSVNSIMAGSSGSSYTGAAALTGGPLMVSCLSGLASLVVSRIYGKRPVYLVAMVFLLIGAAWSTRMRGGYAQFMAPRVFQGLGWGAFDALIVGSVQDTYFEHERSMRHAVVAVATVAGTWGPPLIGGVVSQNLQGASKQFIILSALMGVAVPAIALGAPETNFDRPSAALQTPATPSKMSRRLSLNPRRAVSRYLSTMWPASFQAEATVPTLLQAPRALVAPTTLLAVLVSALPLAALWGFTTSLSLLFTKMPYMLFPTSLGLLLTGPFILGTAAAACAALPLWHYSGAVGRPSGFTPRNHVLAVGLGVLLSFSGALAFGLDVASAADAFLGTAPDSDGTSFLSMPLVSLLLGLLAAGAYMLDGTAWPLVRASTLFTSSNVEVEARASADMGGAAACWRALLAGVFVIATPAAVGSPAGLRAFAIGMSTASVVVAGAVGAVWYFWGEAVRRMDGRVMAMINLGDMGLKKTGSFFDVD